MTMFLKGSRKALCNLPEDTGNVYELLISLKTPIEILKIY